MLRAALFDLDDTLVDQETASIAAVEAWSSELGVTGADIARRWTEISAKHYARYSRREITFGEQRRERVRELLDRSLSDPEADRLFAGYVARYEAGWALFDDAIPALRRARAAGLAVGVLTNGDHGQQQRKLDRLGLSTEIDLLVASSTLPAGKPDPRAFAAALERIGAPASAALMVGDDVDNDLRGALDAGMRAVLIDRRSRHAGSPFERVRSLDELTFIS